MNWLRWITLQQTMKIKLMQSIHSGNGRMNDAINWFETRGALHWVNAVMESIDFIASEWKWVIACAMSSSIDSIPFNLTKQAILSFNSETKWKGRIELKRMHCVIPFRKQSFPPFLLIGWIEWKWNSLQLNGMGYSFRYSFSINITVN